MPQCIKNSGWNFFATSANSNVRSLHLQSSKKHEPASAIGFDVLTSTHPTYAVPKADNFEFEVPSRKVKNKRIGTILSAEANQIHGSSQFDGRFHSELVTQLSCPARASTAPRPHFTEAHYNRYSRQINQPFQCRRLLGTELWEFEAQISTRLDLFTVHVFLATQAFSVQLFVGAHRCKHSTKGGLAEGMGGLH
jgi:hypothetical protein